MPKVSPVLCLLAALAPAPALAAESGQGARLLLDSRTRLESLEQDGPDALALTTRLRLGVQTPTYAGLTGLIEAEGVGVLIDNYADGVRPRPRYATIPDAEILELNRAQVTWAPGPAGEATIGRQRLAFDNQRFIGAVGWRQNEQTFDAVKLLARPVAGVTVNYGYAWRVNRSFGRDHPQGVWRGDIHMLNAEKAWRTGKLTGYAYLLDIDEAPAQSSATVGVRLVGSRPMASGYSATWELEYARQSDWGNAPADYSLDYILASVGMKTQTSNLDLVLERFEGNGRQAFQTPLGTTHGFQGWSDVIGATPAEGLSDLYLRGSKRFDLGRPVKLTGEVHEFRDDSGDDEFGRELDLSLGAPIAKGTNVEVGLGYFDSATPVYPDATRTWLSLEYRY
ncbi:alginate export family protein [Phenylobacterium koreense]|uniref:Alginate export domain-containing protein n=1 Tax=Phenylobacterium koreense TaxID=266125 RepID=A0ABV2ELN4_9CAUL